MIQVPEGWTQVIGGRCPLSVKWPLADQRRQRNSSAIPQESSTSTIQGGAHTVQSKVDRLQSALQALGPKDSSARSAWCNQDCEGRSTKPVPPQQKVAEAAARVGRVEAALALLGEDDPDAEPLKVTLKQAKLQARARPVGERLDLRLQYVRHVAWAEEQVREAKEVQAQMEEKLASPTALSKPDGGVRGIVVGDILRRMVARTIAKQIAKQVEPATVPFQYALSTKAGCECVVHML